MQQSEKQSHWQSFTSLAWYAGVISFCFRFVAMTSEPLLALGVILSAADFLQQGHLMAHNPMLQASWAWAQALAIEASTGPTLAFALAAFRLRDTIKGVLYSILASLLFIVGGAMLFLQLVSNLTGSSEVAINPYVLYSLLALRVLVASGIVALLCTKHMRFSDLLDEPPAAAVQAAAPPGLPNLDELLLKLDSMHQQRMEALYQRTVETVKISILEATNPHLPAIASPLQRLSVSQSEDEPSVLQIPQVTGSRFESKEQAILAALAENPHASAEELAQAANCTPRTAEKWMKRLEVQDETDDTQE